jgi:UPF0271 protein
MNRRIDLNCDLGEGAGLDADLMPLVTSANIACGGHAGNEETMRETVRLAKLQGVAIGAHPGYEDPENFGRVEIPLPPDEVTALITRQVQRLERIAIESGARLSHVKPHGALYNVAARDPETAKAVVRAVSDCGAHLALYALAGCTLAKIAAGHGLKVAHEVFADRAYQADGSLVPRSRPGAVHADESVMIQQVLSMVTRGVVTAGDGSEVSLRADTLCLHGDGKHAVEFARRIRDALAEAGVAVEAFGLR